MVRLMLELLGFLYMAEHEGRSLTSEIMLHACMPSESSTAALLVAVQVGIKQDGVVS